MTKSQLIEALRIAPTSGRSEIVFYIPGAETSIGDAVYCIDSMEVEHLDKEVIVVRLVKSCDDIKIM